MSDLMSFLFGSNSNANPYTDQMLSLLKQQQGQSQGNMNGLVNSSLSNYNPQNFLTQFLNNAGGLGALAQGSQTGQDALMRQASMVGQNAVQDVAGQFAGLGSLYSGGAASQATQAFAQPMFQAMSQGSQQQNALLQQLYGGAMSGLQQGNIAQMQGGLQAAGQYAGLAGTGLESLAGYGSPLIQANPGLFQQLLSGAGNIGSLMTGMAGVSGAGGLSNILAGLI